MDDIKDSYRPHQVQLHCGVQRSFRNGHRRIMAMLATGGGKTRCAAGMLQRALQAGASPTRPALFLVPRITLAAQAARAFVDLGLDNISVLQADNPNFNPASSLQVCSVQTLESRPAIFESASIIIVDEAHIKRQFLFELAERWPTTPMIGLSATPTSRGLGKLYTDLVVGATCADLVRDDYLVPSKVFEPSVYDVSGVRAGSTESGYNEKQLYDAVSGQKEITGNVVSNWIEHGDGRPTICFPVNTKHSKEIVSRFLEAGVEAAHIEANTPLEDRQIQFRRIVDGDLKVISSVGCLTEGLDIPEVSCLIFARPTRSLELHIQMWGRGLRKPPAGWPWQDCKVFDHGGNTLRLMHAEDYAPSALDDGSGKKKDDADNLAESERVKSEPAKCGGCGAIKRRGIHQCEYCGFAPAPADTGVIERSGKLVSLTDRLSAPSSGDRRGFYRQLLFIAAERGYSPGWCYHKYIAKHDEKPHYMWRNLSPQMPSPKTRQWVKSQQKRWVKNRKKEALA